MSSLPGDDVLASARTTPTTVVDGDVVFSGVALLFVALGLAFVLYHYVTVHRLQGQRDAAAGTSLPSISARQHGAVGVGAAAASGVQGVDQVAQRALPVTLYNANSKDDFEDQELECAVCLGELYGGEAARFLPKCGHGFHAECVDLWLRSHPTCPLCRVDVDKQPDALLPLALLPPVLPEPANYGATQLPANVLFWGSQDDAATSARAVGGTGVVVIEVPETTSPSRAPREADAAKSRGLARVKSIKRLWSRGRREVGASTGSSSTSFCHRASSSAHAEAGTGVADGDFEP